MFQPKVADPVARADAEARQRRGEPLGALGDGGEGGAAGALALEGDDGAAAVHGAAVREEVGDGEGMILHRAQHVGDS